MIKNLGNILSYFRAYTQYDLKRELLAWLKILKFYLPVIGPVVLVAVVIFIYIKPVPVDRTYLATGQESSLTDQMGKSFSRYFEQHGLSLQEINTTGLHAGLHQLSDDESKINASFVTSGTATSKDYPNLVSLGTVNISPLWLFYRGKTIHTDDPFEYYRDKLIGIGADGTVTNKLFNRLMELNNPGTGARSNFLELSHAEAAKQLRNGKIDALFIVDGYNSPIIQSLLNDPTIQLMNFPLAEAYARKLPFLQKIVVPKASVDINHVRPASDITLLASSVNLLVEKDIHPTVQWAFLMAAQDLNLKSEQFFTSAGSFPAYKDKSFPLSFVADRFYTHGTPVLFEYLPLRLAALIENIWVILIAIFLIALPFIKKLSNFRSQTSEKLLWKSFWELRYLEDRLNDATTPSATESIINELLNLDTKVSTAWSEGQHIRHYYNLKRCIGDTLKSAQKKQTAMDS
ncbi:MAG: hypothetical protein ACOYBQ_09425 [Fluviibacter sp.]